jgi:hypothetical protein
MDLIRGGNCNNGSNTGVSALNLNNDRGNSNWNNGFRLAFYYSSILKLKGLR